MAGNWGGRSSENEHADAIEKKKFKLLVEGGRKGRRGEEKMGLPCHAFEKKEKN